jgi:hypothetical protein
MEEKYKIHNYCLDVGTIYAKAEDSGKWICVSCIPRSSPQLRTTSEAGMHRDIGGHERIFHSQGDGKPGTNEQMFTQTFTEAQLMRLASEGASEWWKSLRQRGDFEDPEQGDDSVHFLFDLGIARSCR